LYRELSTLCNTRVGVFRFTPGDKPFAFGSPSFQAKYPKHKNGFGSPYDKTLQLCNFKCVTRERIKKLKYKKVMA
jgi:hypothetical protein